MNLSRISLLVTTALITALIMSGGSAAHALREPARHTGWYITLGVGASRAATIEQAGHSLDTNCYPNDDCTRLPGGLPSGYRWYYNLLPGTGATFELAVGHASEPFRLELAGSRRLFDVEQEFRRSSYLDGSTRRLVREEDRAYASTTSATIDDLTIHDLSLNAYYDITLARRRIAPYLGGRARAVVRRVVRAALPGRVRLHRRHTIRKTETLQWPSGRRPFG